MIRIIHSTCMNDCEYIISHEVIKHDDSNLNLISTVCVTNTIMY